MCVYATRLKKGGRMSKSEEKKGCALSGIKKIWVSINRKHRTVRKLLKCLRNEENVEQWMNYKMLSTE